MRRVYVLGSINIDLVQRVPRMPLPGETLHGDGLQIFVGGKGANQACAAARLGAEVCMAGRVGDDAFAERLIRELQSADVDTQLVSQSPGPSGSATIFVLPDGENTIVTSAGANAELSNEFATQVGDQLQAGDLLLCQLETPLGAVFSAIQAARRKQATTILDPAPACALPDELLSYIDVLTPNQTEAAILLGVSEIPARFAEAEAAARKLQARGAKAVIVKLGAQGCFVAEEEHTTALEGWDVDVIDTTAAGDTFNGGLAAALAGGASLTAAARFANAAAALSVMKAGAIASIPTRSAVEQLLSSLPALA